MKQDLKPKPEDRYRTANGLLTFNGCFIAREPEEPSKSRKLKTEQLTGALFDDPFRWASIDWKTVESNVRRLQ